MGVTRGKCTLILWSGVAEQEQFLFLLLAYPNEWMTQHGIHFSTQIHLCVNKSECDRHHLRSHGGDDLYVCVQCLGSGYTTQVTSSISAPATKFIFSNPLKQRGLRWIGLTHFRRPITTPFASRLGYSQHQWLIVSRSKRWNENLRQVVSLRWGDPRRIWKRSEGSRIWKGKKPNKGVFSGEVPDLTRLYGQ